MFLSPKREESNPKGKKIKEIKKMKKNKFMKLASGLLVLCLMTTCVIGATLAKYVTADTKTDSARVAKWGVTVTGEATTFAEAYAKTDDTFTVATNSVESTDKVVAPGTSGDMAAFTITGTPEVAVRVTAVGTLDLGDKWVVSGSYYCPLEITVGDTTIKGTDKASAEEFEDAVNAAIATYSKDYEAGTGLSTIGGDALKISWKWAFEGNDDAKDTFLGNQAAADASNAATVSLSVTVTVTQID